MAKIHSINEINYNQEFNWAVTATEMTKINSNKSTYIYIYKVYLMFYDKL